MASLRFTRPLAFPSSYPQGPARTPITAATKRAFASKWATPLRLIARMSSATVPSADLVLIQSPSS